MIAALKNWQEVLTANGYADSAQLLEMSALDLQMKLHSISEAELAQFCEAIGNTLLVSDDPNSMVGHSGPHFNGSERLSSKKNIVIMSEVRAANRVKTDH